MSDIVIQAEGLGKSYIIGHQQRESYVALRDVIANSVRQYWSRLRNPQHSTHSNQEEFWALKDINFEIKKGERVGIIGRNGAGKSTLLKVLSRITEPTTGKIKIAGRVASLLEVGTGFHSELTGRENIFLNGAILGMSRSYIKNKFDEIVAFAEVEKFLDTPVKRYSSGMYVRLAFAVAAHLEPEILIVDEVLAVGDVAFQRKCFQKIEEVGNEGRTVLLVSHNMEAVRRMCDKGMVLASGQLVCVGNTDKAVGYYLNNSFENTGIRDWTSDANTPGNKKVKARKVSVRNCVGAISSSFDIKNPINIEIELTVTEPGLKINTGFFLCDDSEKIIFMSTSMHDKYSRDLERKEGVYISNCEIPGNFLSEGIFSISIMANSMFKAKSPEVHFYEKNILRFEVYDDMTDGSARCGHTGAYYGMVRPILPWNTKYIHSGDLS